MNECLLHLSGKELKNRLISGEITVLDVAKKVISRQEKIGKSINCFISFDADYIIEQAKLLDQLDVSSKSKLPLFGQPISVKDLISTTKLPTTAASKILSNYRPPYNATVVDRLLKAGGLIVGKTNLDEFGMGSTNENSYYGPVLNPWDFSRVAGGSSGGSAASVAAGLSLSSLGTDTGGSVRQPASFCNVLGIKPTYGRVSRYGVVAYASSLDQVGVLGRYADDLEDLLGVISGYDELDSTSARINELSKSTLNKDLAGLKVGIPKEFFPPQLEAETASCIEKFLNLLQSFGAVLKDISLKNTKLAVPTYYIIAPAEASSNLARYDGVKYGYRAQGCSSLEEMYLKSRSEGFGSEVKKRILIGSYVLSSGYYDAYYLKAMKIRRMIQEELNQKLSDECDLIISPVAPRTAFKIGEKFNDPLELYLSDIYTIPANLAGLPAISIPAGFNQNNSLPIGVQLIGPAWSEEKLISIAKLYQTQTDWHLRNPKE